MDAYATVLCLTLIFLAKEINVLLCFYLANRHFKFLSLKIQQTDVSKKPKAFIF